jgi:hypothetical protein
MGLMNFWKKKGLDQPTPPPIDNKALTSDLPTLDGSTFNNTSFDGSNVEKFDNLQQTATPEAQAKDLLQKSISFNVPTLDFTLPAKDDEKDASKDIASKDASSKDNTQPVQSDSKDYSQSTDAKTGEDMEYEDLNKLFITDQDWKEPDWNNFDPYVEERIDKPNPQDFGGEQLPHFKDISAGKPMSNYADRTVSEPDEPLRKKSRSESNPPEIFVRGNAYGEVFTELELMNKSLTRIDAQVGYYEEMLKKEEPLLVAGKDEMEYLYKKFSQVDKKIFTQ